MMTTTATAARRRLPVVNSRRVEDHDDGDGDDEGEMMIMTVMAMAKISTISTTMKVATTAKQRSTHMRARKRARSCTGVESAGGPSIDRNIPQNLTALFDRLV